MNPPIDAGESARRDALPPPDGAAALRRDRDAIAEAWTQSVRSLLRPPASVDAVPRLEEIDALLDCLLRRLEGRRQACPEAFVQHAERQLRLGVDIPMLLRQYSLLRRAVMSHMAAAGQLSIAEATTLEDAFDQGIELALSRISSEYGQTMRAIDAVITLAMQPRPDVDVLERLLCTMVESSSAVQASMLFIWDAERLVFRAAAGVPAEEVSSISSRLGQGFAGRVAAAKTPEFLSISTDHPLARDPLVAKHRMRAVYGIPLLHQGETIGVLVMGSTTASEFSPTNRLFFHVIANRATSFLVQARLVERETAARRASQESAALLSSIFESAPIGLAFLDTDLRYVAINAALAKLNRRPVADHLGKRPHELLSPKLAAQVEEICREVLSSGRPREQIPLAGRLSKEGELRSWVASFFPVPIPGGGLMGVGVAIVETTEQRRVEQALRESDMRFHLALRNSSVVVFEQDLDLRYRWVFNPHLHRGPEEVVGRSEQEVFPPSPGRDALVALKRRALESGEPAQGDVTVTNAGQTREYRAEVEPLRDEGGRLIGLIGAATDITERKRIEEQMARTAAFRDKFIGVLGHDLRNPLNAMKISSQLLLRQEGMSGAQLTSVRRIMDLTDKMSRMISDILDFARGRMGGGIPIERRGVDMGELADRAIEELQLANPERRIAVERSGGLRGEWDPDRVSQVIGNLVSNALLHGDPASPVAVALRGSGDEVLLTVHNRGSPIPESALPALFEPFHASTGAPSSGGLGLGLYIVAEILRSHGARIDVRSSAEEGTTFSVCWPRVAPPPPAALG